MNSVHLSGNMTRDPELTFTADGTAICKFGLAKNEKYKGKEKVLFVDCVAFGNTGENINKFFSKGRPILVDGRLSYSEWQTKEGSKRNRLEIAVFGFDFMGDGGKKKAPSEAAVESKKYAEFDPSNEDDDVPF